MSVIDVNGARIASRTSRRGEPVVLLHCTCGSGAQWQALCAALAHRSDPEPVDPATMRKLNPVVIAPIIDGRAARMRPLYDTTTGSGRRFGRTVSFGPVCARGAGRGPRSNALNRRPARAVRMRELDREGGSPGPTSPTKRPSGCATSKVADSDHQRRRRTRVARRHLIDFALVIEKLRIRFARPVAELVSNDAIRSAYLTV